MDHELEYMLLVRRWVELCQRAVALIVCVVGQLHVNEICHKKISYSLSGKRERVRDEIMSRISRCPSNRNIIRMTPRAFLELCGMLEREGGLRTTRFSTVEEQVAKTLYILTHSVKSREVNFWFRRSGETISHHLHKVLMAIIELEDKFVEQPDGSRVAPEIQNEKKFFPYFKDCVGAIDGTHIRVKVSSVDAPRYRGRKDYPTQNVLAACTFDLKFSYLLPGWEGTASDSRIIKNALTREDRLKIPEGKYYLVDAGFMLTGGLITPYRGVRYHLKEYSRRNPPINYKELFNLRHAKLRNAIERAFGVLKKRFAIISNATEPTYGIKVQKMIIYACIILHNFLMSVDGDDDLIREVDMDLRRQSGSNDNNRAPSSNNIEAARGELVRDNIATQMWTDYQNNHEHTLDNDVEDEVEG